jgi:hypothetical protein
MRRSSDSPGYRASDPDGPQAWASDPDGPQAWAPDPAGPFEGPWLGLLTQHLTQAATQQLIRLPSGVGEGGEALTPVSRSPGRSASARLKSDA